MGAINAPDAQLAMIQVKGYGTVTKKERIGQDKYRSLQSLRCNRLYHSAW